MRKRDRSLLSNATSLLICGLLAGVVVAAAAFPAVALTGLAAKASSDAFDSMPSVLTVNQNPQITSVYASDNKTLLTTFYDELRRDVHIDQVNPIMPKAIVASEDMRFYQHHGVDARGIARAFVANQSAGLTEQGASTLTMQYVRQALEYSSSSPQDIVNATADTTGRKIQEMRYALALEKQLTKTQILERYLNIAPFGNGAFGIYAASEVYFGIPPSELDLAQAALLAGLVKAPSAYDPMTKDGLAKALDRRNNYVLVNMVKLGYITEAQRQQASAEQPKLVGKTTPNDCTGVPNNSWGFFCDYFYRWWLQQPAFGADAYERENRLKSGGYRIVTSLDVKEQAAAVRNISQSQKESFKLKPSDALMLAGVEPGTGRIKIMAVNRKFSNDQRHNGTSTNPAKAAQGIKGNYPNTTLPLISGGGDVTGYQYGSTFKVFTMVTALKQGIPLSYTFNAPDQFVSDYIIDPNTPSACQGNHYCPTNAGKEAGVYDIWDAFGKSVNTFFVPLEQRVGADKVVDTAKSMGIQFRARSNDMKHPADYEMANNRDYARQWGAFTLGVSGSTPLDVANAYATLAAEGKYCAPLPVISIQDLNGNKLAAASPRCNQVMSTDVARAASDAARCPVGDQSQYGMCKKGGTAGPTRDIVGKPVAGKTGTTDHNQTAALTAMTKQLAVSGIVADADCPQVCHRDYSHAQVNYAVQHTLHDAMVGKPAIQFGKPSQKLAFGDMVSMPNVVCKSVQNATAILRGAGFDVSVSSAQQPSGCPPGTVAATNPSGRNVKGGSVQLILSSGGGGPGGPGGGGGPVPPTGPPGRR